VFLTLAKGILSGFKGLFIGGLYIDVKDKWCPFRPGHITRNSKGFHGFGGGEIEEENSPKTVRLTEPMETIVSCSLRAQRIRGGI